MPRIPPVLDCTAAEIASRGLHPGYHPIRPSHRLFKLSVGLSISTLECAAFQDRPESAMPLTKKQIRQLKSLVHHLNPVVIIGQNGLTEAVFNELDITLNTHELIKVRLNAGEREERQEMIVRICDRCNAELVQSIGHVAAFFRRNPDKPVISLSQD
jgi:RNA-binding protein